MNKNVLIGSIIGLVVGIGTTIGAGAILTMNDTNDVQVSMDNNSMSMTDMNKQLGPKSGDDFDKAFIEMMIIHHEGAIDMANLATTRAKHDEIKTLSQAIITAQAKEITDMKQWQQSWGYSTSNSHDMDMMR